MPAPQASKPPVVLISLFDGIGTIPTAAKLVIDNIHSIYTSEIDPAASKIARERHPEATHLGDVTLITSTTLAAIIAQAP